MEILNSSYQLCSGIGKFHTNKDTAKNKKPYMTISLEQIRELVDKPQHVKKEDSQWLIPSTHPSRCSQEQQTNGQFPLLWADFDNVPKGIDALDIIVRAMLPDSNFELYTSRSATEANQKSRLLIPLSTPLAWADWAICQQILNDLFEMAGIAIDRVNEKPAQLCYLPNQGAFYKAIVERNAAFFEPMLIWADTIGVERAVLEAAAVEAATRNEAATAAKAAYKTPHNNNGTTSPIDAFNACHTVADILLEAGYDQHPTNVLLFRHPASQSHNYSAAILNGRVRTMSTSDPLHVAKGSHDAYSAYTVLMHDNNQTAAMAALNVALLQNCLDDLDAVVELNRRASNFVCYDEETKVEQVVWAAGVWHCFTNKDGEADRTYICTPLRILSVLSDGSESNYGRLVRFKSTNGLWHDWAMPMEMLKGTGEELRGELLAMGVIIQPSIKARALLLSYFLEEPPESRMQCAAQVGWCGASFVLPDQVYGPDAGKIHFQSGERGHNDYSQNGTLAGWRDEISVLAVKNPILMIAIGAAFAAPLAKQCNQESGGFHLVGDSSIGKSSALEVGCSVWGGEGFKRSWRTTSNGLEGAAVLFNDCLLALDEISECEPREIGAIVYALGNGRGKQRATRSGNARGVNRWRSFVLSTGERSIGTAMKEGGFRSKAGQSVRLLDIPTQRTYGIYDELHGYVSGQVLSDSLKKAVTQNYGVVGRAFLEALTNTPNNGTTDLVAKLQEIKDKDAFKATEPQHKRAAARFALVALAGELATEYGLTGWPKGAAVKAASIGFRLWADMRGEGTDERHKLLEQLSEFLDKHADSRFSTTRGLSTTQVRDKAGWVETLEDDTCLYLFNSAGLQEALKGFDFKSSLDVLVEAKVLPPAHPSTGARSTTRRLDGQKQRVYQINHNNLADALGWTFEDLLESLAG